MEREQALVAGSLDLALQLRIPPNVVHVHDHAYGAAAGRVQLVAQVQRLSQGVHATAVGTIHRVHGLHGERHAARARVIEHLAETVTDHFTRAAEIFRLARQTARHDHQAVRAERRRLLDGTKVVIDRRLATLAIGRGEKAAPAQPGYDEPTVPNHAGGLLRADLRHSIAPWRDAMDAMATNRVDRLPQVARFPQGGGVDR